MAEGFSKPAKMPLPGFQKWCALCCPLFKRELFIGNLFAGFQNRGDCPLPVFKSSSATPNNLSSNRSKVFEFASFEKLL
jgi:hypothetical protein